MFVQIPGYPLYLVNHEGTVISMKCGGWRVLSPAYRGGYLVVCLSNEAVQKVRTVHRLVMLAYCGPSELVVNHKNGVKDDNRLENLEYCTIGENNRHAWATGLYDNAVAKTRENRKTPPTKTGAAQLKDLKGKMPAAQAAELFGISIAQVKRVWNGGWNSRFHRQIPKRA